MWFAVFLVSLEKQQLQCLRVYSRFEPQAPPLLLLPPPASPGLYGASPTSLPKKTFTSAVLNPFTDCSVSSCITVSTLACPLLPLALLLLCIHTLFCCCCERPPSCLGGCDVGFCWLGDPVPERFCGVREDELDCRGRPTFCQGLQF